MKRFLILCNGEPPEPELLSEQYAASDYFIAADGGGNVALRMEIPPDVVIGDLDSFQKQPGRDIKTIHQPEQESNDLEKALELARQKGGVQATILGATGHRLDHTLKNLSVLKQFNADFEKLIFIDNYGRIQLLPSSFRHEYPVGTPISLFPLSGKVTGISTAGLKYPLHDEALENGVRDGSSNQVVSSPVEISHKAGDLLLFTAH